MTQLNTTARQAVDLRPGPTWTSFEKLRTAGSDAIDAIDGGSIGTLNTKRGQYRILTENDFQRLLGLARDVERLSGGLQLVVQAVRIVRKNPTDQDNLDLLASAVALIGNTPVLPTQKGHDALHLEADLEADPDDDVILESGPLKSSLVHRDANSGSR